MTSFLNINLIRQGREYQHLSLCGQTRTATYLYSQCSVQTGNGYNENRRFCANSIRTDLSLCDNFFTTSLEYLIAHNFFNRGLHTAPRVRDFCNKLRTDIRGLHFKIYA